MACGGVRVSRAGSVRGRDGLHRRAREPMSISGAPARPQRTISRPADEHRRNPMSEGRASPSFLSFSSFLSRDLWSASEASRGGVTGMTKITKMTGMTELEKKVDPWPSVG